MAYTPINWQTGDTITAEKLNKMDNGWAVTSSSGTLLFSETVVTENDGDFNYGVLSYSEEVPDGALTVTFDGTDYTCTCSDTEFGSTDESFEDYPFYVFWSGMAQSNAIETATEGTHTIAVSAGGGETVETSSDFSAAVNSCVEPPSNGLFLCVDGVTTKQAIEDAWLNGTDLLYFVSERRYIITSIVFNTGQIDFIPANSQITATFDINDKFSLQF